MTVSEEAGPQIGRQIPLFVRNPCVFPRSALTATCRATGIENKNRCAFDMVLISYNSKLLPAKSSIAQRWTGWKTFEVAWKLAQQEAGSSGPVLFVVPFWCPPRPDG